MQQMGVETSVSYAVYILHRAFLSLSTTSGHWSIFYIHQSLTQPAITLSLTFLCNHFLSVLHNLFDTIRWHSDIQSFVLTFFNEWWWWWWIKFIWFLMSYIFLIILWATCYNFHDLCTLLSVSSRHHWVLYFDEPCQQVHPSSLPFPPTVHYRTNDYTKDAESGLYNLGTTRFSLRFFLIIILPWGKYYSCFIPTAPGVCCHSPSLYFRTPHLPFPLTLALSDNDEWDDTITNLIILPSVMIFVEY